MPPSSHAEFLARRSFGSLDGIRCLSIVAVVWHHTVRGVEWLPGSERGFLGVDMFFALSGFLIVTLLLRERDRNRVISLRGFYRRRALRIFPAYYGLLAVLIVVFGWIRPDGVLAKPFFAELPWYLSYTSNWVELHTLLAISWSLAAEQQFYLFWPPVEKWLPRGALVILAGVVLVSQLVNFRLLDESLATHFGLHYDKLPMLQATFTPICLGVWLAHVLHSPAGFERARRWLSSDWSAPALLALVIALANAPSQDISGWLRPSIQLAMTALLCACVIREDHGLARVLRLGPIARIGVISYGMYLYHPFARHAAEGVIERVLPGVPLAMFAACLALTVAISELSYRFYEEPFLRAKKRATETAEQGRSVVRND